MKVQNQGKKFPLVANIPSEFKEPFGVTVFITLKKKKNEFHNKVLQLNNVSELLHGNTSLRELTPQVYITSELHSTTSQFAESEISSIRIFGASEKAEYYHADIRPKAIVFPDYEGTFDVGRSSKIVGPIWPWTDLEIALTDYCEREDWEYVLHDSATDTLTYASEDTDPEGYEITYMWATL